MAHLSTRIRTRKSREDGQKRAADRRIEKLLVRTRARQDAATRREDSSDDVALETPATWLSSTCAITGVEPASGELFGLPFVADRGDITSGNLLAGGQNVDRMPVACDALFSMRAIRELMWEPSNGQMAAPFLTGSGAYNAAIPVLLGPASPSSVRALERAIGWLCTGTSAFEAPMAEAIPAALASVLGRLDDDPHPGGHALTRDQQAHALLRTSALLGHFRSYPYIPNTATLDESADKQPLPHVWGESLAAMGDGASSQNVGCTTSLLARAVAADRVSVSATAQSLWAWCCRNIARSLFNAISLTPDGDGGLEAVLRFAALMYLNADVADVLLLTAPSTQLDSKAGAVDTSLLSGEALTHILGPLVAGLWSPSSLAWVDFTDALNAWLNTLGSAVIIDVLPELQGIFERFDDYIAQHVSFDVNTHDPTPSTAGGMLQPGVILEDVEHHHFGIPHLDALRPQRFFTSPPRLANENLAMYRMLKQGEVRWIPPRDAVLAEGDYNPSALAYLNAHSAMHPLRAFLRLHLSGLLGQDALQTLRRESTATTPIQRCDDLFPALASLLGGMDQVVLILLRAFAYVVTNAHSYADKRWTESRERHASLKHVAKVLNLPQQLHDQSTARHYGAATWSIPPRPKRWPAVVGMGYLPKSRVVDGTGQRVGDPVVCPEDTLTLDDAALCQRGATEIIERRSVALGDSFIGNLHRGARHVLGAFTDDLHTLDRDTLQTVMRRTLIPQLAGRVKGAPDEPSFFVALMQVIDQLMSLDVDTRTFRAEEPEDFLHTEAQALRDASAAS